MHKIGYTSGPSVTDYNKWKKDFVVRQMVELHGKVGAGKTLKMLVRQYAELEQTHICTSKSK